MECRVAGTLGLAVEGKRETGILRGDWDWLGKEIGIGSPEGKTRTGPLRSLGLE